MKKLVPLSVYRKLPLAAKRAVSEAAKAMTKKRKSKIKKRSY